MTASVGRPASGGRAARYRMLVSLVWTASYVHARCGDESGSEVTGISYNSLQVIAEQVGTLHG
jgi:hypothetical protein